MSLYVALLRGINVGGKNLIRMSELRGCFEQHGFRDVATYIQSGNVLFSTTGSEGAALAVRIEELLGRMFSYRASVVLRTRKEMQDVVRRAPRGFGARPAMYRYDVIFLKEPLTASAAIEGVPTKEGVDQAHAGDGVVYFSRLISRAAESQLNKLASRPIYKSMTIRNWNTTTKLVQLMEAAEQ
jgi:uncharacterized protein (DUF1697 family)